LKTCGFKKKSRGNFKEIEEVTEKFKEYFKNQGQIPTPTEAGIHSRQHTTTAHSTEARIHPHPQQPKLTSFIHSSTHPLIHSSTHPLIHSSTHPLIHPSDQPTNSAAPHHLRKLLYIAKKNRFFAPLHTSP